MNAVSSFPQDNVSPQPNRVFPDNARETFAAAYPEQPHVLEHRLEDHPLLRLDALAELAGRLPESSIEYNRGDLPIGVDGKPGQTGLSIADTIRRIAEVNSWAVLKNIEQDDRYRALLHDLLEELRPEHNILMQLRGSKTMTQFPAGDARYAPDEVHEGYHLGGPRELIWKDDLAQGGVEYGIAAGQALFVPVMAPHFVRNGPESSISLSITWRSDWSYAEADARGFNRELRRLGLNPREPGRWPASNRSKAFAFRAIRKLGMIR